MNGDGVERGERLAGDYDFDTRFPLEIEKYSKSANRGKKRREITRGGDDRRCFFFSMGRNYDDYVPRNDQLGNCFETAICARSW